MPRLTNEQRDEIVKRYQVGEISSHLAKEYGVDRSSIDGLIRRRGLVPHQKSYVFRTASGHQLNEQAFDSINEESAYWIGFLMADGAVVNNIIAVALQAQDIEHLEKFKNFVGGTQKITPIATGTFRYAFQSSKIVEKIASYGVNPCKSLTAKATDELVLNRHFWRGVVDGDGSLGLSHRSNRRKPETRFELVGSFEMIKQFLEYVDKNIVQTEVQITKTKSIYRVQFSCNPAKEVVSHLYCGSSVYLNRKMLLATEILASA